MDLEAAPYNLVNAIEATLDVLAPLASRKRLDLTFEMAEELPNALIGDVGRFARSCSTCSTTRLKFTETGRRAVDSDVVTGCRATATRGSCISRSATRAWAFRRRR